MLKQKPRVEMVSKLLDVGPRHCLDDKDPARRERPRKGLKQAALQVVELHDDV